MTDDRRPTNDDRQPPSSATGRPSSSRERRLIERLLGARGIGRHALFLTQREGLDLPDGVEAVSGFALDDRGRVHGFWLAWDEWAGDYTLEPFYRVEEPERAFADDEEYCAVRATLGLG